MSESEVEIEMQNRRELWVGVTNHLRAAQRSIEQAQGVLEDLGYQRLIDLLEPHANELRRYADANAEVWGG